VVLIGERFMGVLADDLLDVCPSCTKTHAGDNQKEREHTKRADIELSVRVSHFYGGGGIRRVAGFQFPEFSYEGIT